MSKKTGYLLGILLTIIVGIILNWWLCCGAQAESSARIDDDHGNQNPAVQTASIEAFSLNDPDSDFAFKCDENFNFNRSEFTIIKPLAAQVQQGIDNLKSFLSADINAGKFVNITGYYQGHEENNSAFPNLGLARANAVKEYFVSKGISAEHINTYGALNETLVPSGNIYHGPVIFVIGTQNSEIAVSEEASKELNATLERIQADPLVFYFETSKATLIVQPANIKKITDILYYLENADGATLLVTGHTDNTGSQAGNMKLGQNRAIATKEYLVSNAIAESRILITSEGAENPVASNASTEGRAKNRRTVVTIN